MKLRHPWLLRVSGFAGAAVLRLWMQTLSFRYHPLGENFDPSQVRGGRFIYAIWHEYLLLPVFCYPRSDVRVLISQHADGQLLTEICQALRIPVVRGSSTRGGVEALRGMLRAGEASHLALTPDGPRGPRRHVQHGLVYLAARLGMPIVPVGFGLQRPWRARSWDRFAVPRPWTRATCVTANPICVPADARRDVIAAYRDVVEEELLYVTRRAEAWAETGAFDGSNDPTTIAIAPPQAAISAPPLPT